MAKKAFAVIGLGDFGTAVAEELVSLGMDVIAIDENQDNVDRIAKVLDTAFVANPADEKALIDLGINSVDVAVVAMGGKIDTTIITTVVLRELQVKSIIVRVDDDYYIPVVKRLGATEIVSPQKSAGADLANRLTHDDYREYYKIDNLYSIVSIEVNPSFVPTPLKDLNSKAKFGVNIVLIIRNGRSFVPGGLDSILPDDIIYVVGAGREIKAFRESLNGRIKIKHDRETEKI